MNKNGLNNKYITNAAESVNSHDYWVFRKLNNDETPASLIVHEVGDEIVKNHKDMNLSEATIIEIIKKMYDTPKAVKSENGSNARVMVQYLNQLSDKGIAAIVNKINLYVRMKRQ